MRTAWMMGLGLAVAAGAAVQGKIPVAEPDVVVYVENDGLAPGNAVVALAKNTAAAMFAGIGVRVAWVTEGKGSSAATAVVLHLQITDRP
jgi:hypothetical protein